MLLLNRNMKRPGLEIWSLAVKSLAFNSWNSTTVDPKFQVQIEEANAQDKADAEADLKLPDVL